MTFESTIVYPGRIRIMRILAQKGEATVHQLKTLTGNDHGVILKHLHALEKSGVVAQKLVGKTRLWTYADTPRGCAVKKFFVEMEEKQ